MGTKTEYQIISGEKHYVEAELNRLSKMGWYANGSITAVIFENFLTFSILVSRVITPNND